MTDAEKVCRMLGIRRYAIVTYDEEHLSGWHTVASKIYEGDPVPKNAREKPDYCLPRGLEYVAAVKKALQERKIKYAIFFDGEKHKVVIPLDVFGFSDYSDPNNPTGTGKTEAAALTAAVLAMREGEGEGE